MVSTASEGPANTASTEPSRRLRTQPSSPRSSAWCCAQARKYTPWTRPFMEAITMRWWLIPFTLARLPCPAISTRPTRRREFTAEVKPSHYDDDGYVIQWLRSPIPANSLACLYGLARDCRERQVLGPDIDLDIVAIDETNTRTRPDKSARQIKAADQGLVMLVGVQSNQFPRALDIAARLRQQDITVGIGGFHVSGTLAMLPGIEPNVQRALDMGCFLYAGEAEEGRLDVVLRDAAAHRPGAQTAGCALEVCNSWRFDRGSRPQARLSRLLPPFPHPTQV